MIEVLNHIDDLKKIRNLMKTDVDMAMKQCEEAIAYHENKVKEFEKWVDEECQKDMGVGDYDFKSSPEGGTVVSKTIDSSLQASPRDFSGDKSE
jgi:malate synthase|tara:strand:+ start:39 stop:320 length:282 start_codon:yes stop_codon:yes gene_type:complete